MPSDTGETGLLEELGSRHGTGPRVRRHSVVVASTRLSCQDIPVLEMARMILDATAGLKDSELIAGNMRFRISHDEAFIGSNEYESTVYGLELLYNAPMTDEEIEEARDELAKIKAEREASDRVVFERYKERYGW